MRSVLIRKGLAPVLFVAILTVTQGAAIGGGPTCAQKAPSTGECVLWVEDPGEPENPGTKDEPQDTGSGAACYWDPSKAGQTKPPAGPVPCTSSAGYWSNTRNCYLSALDPQPAAGDPQWLGHEPGAGAVYSCFQPQTGIFIYLWAQDPPPGAGAGPTPRDVAQRAVEQMSLQAITIGTAPEPGDDHIGLVGLPVWMWAANPEDHTVGPITATATAGGITITATARLVHVTWDMGDGSKVVCQTAGTPYKKSFGRAESPDCGYEYEKTSAHEPAQRYAVTATSDWAITWSGAGQTGVIRLGGLTRTTHITIGEAQVLVN